MSDEGLMWDELESCLDVVCNAVERSTLAPERSLLWCARMEHNDRMQLCTRLRIPWTKSYPPEVRSAVADALISDLAEGRDRDPPLSDRRREAILRHAARALDLAGRAPEIPSLREFSAQQTPRERKPSHRWPN